MKSLVEICDLEDALLQFLDHLFLCLCALFGHVSNVRDLLGSLLVLRIKLRVMLGQLAESLTRGRFNLERFDFLENVSAVHSLDHSIDVAHELLFQDFSML